MSGQAVGLRDVVDALRREGLLSETASTHAEQHLGAIAPQPWYVRAMVGVGAWLASLLLFSFFAELVVTWGSYAAVGAALIVASTVARRQSGGDFAVQATLAASLAGQLLFAYGIARLLPSNTLQAFCAVVPPVSVLLFIIFPDRVHRVLCILFAASAMIALLYLRELNALIAVLGPAFAVLLVLLDEYRTWITARGYGHLLRPLQSGLMLSAFATLLLSTIYVLPELHIQFEFYPRPWISTLMLGGLLLYVVDRTAPTLLNRVTGTARLLVYGLLLLTIAVSWAAPGVLLSLVIVLHGVATGNRSFAGAGIAFLGVFVGAWFYGIEATMLTKSITLIAAGALLLLMRNMLLARVDSREDAHHG